VCYGPDFAEGDQTPRLANQREDYLLKALRDFKSGRRIGYTPAMQDVLAEVSDAEIVDLAHFLAHAPR
jgi:cytochrome c553